MLKILSTAAAASLLVAGAAAAATVSWAPTPGTIAPNPLATITTGGFVDQNVTGSIVNERRSPFEGGDPADDGFVYTSVGGGETATYDFGLDSSSISFVWGSPDTYNVLTFLDEDGNEVDSYTYDGSQGSGSNIPNAFATVTADEAFQSVVFASINTNAFEFANLSVAAVPLPAAGLLLMGALGAMGIARRRKAA